MKTIDDDVIPFRMINYDILSSNRNKICYNELFVQLYYEDHLNKEDMGNEREICNMDHGLYLYTHLPNQTGIYLEKRRDQFDNLLKLDKENNEWIKHLVGRTVVCPMFKLSCEINKLVDLSTVSGDCVGDVLFNDSKTISCPSKSWFLVRGFSQPRDEFTQKSSWQQACVDVVIGANNTFRFAEHMMPNIDIRRGSLLSRNGSIGRIFKSQFRGILRFEVLRGTFTPGQDNFCFNGNFLSFFNVLRQLEEYCPIESLIVNDTRQTIYLDKSDSVGFKARLRFNSNYPISKFIRKMNLIYVTLSHIDQLHVRTHYIKEKNEDSMDILLTQSSHTSGVTSITISTQIQHSKCEPQRHVFRVVGSCPSYKKIHFDPPYIAGSSNYETKLRTELPVNYQPPSTLGTHLPVTKNVYNVDGSKEMYHGDLVPPLVDPVYKQCALGSNVRKRADCNCNYRKTKSSLVIFSDCINEARRLLFKEKFSPRIKLGTISGATTLTSAYMIAEVNNRTDYKIENAEISTNGDFHMSVPNNSRIVFSGPGLFHFRIELVDATKSFCNLNSEFLVYVDKAPLPSHIMVIVRATAVSIFGGTIFFFFLYHFYTDDNY